MTTRDDIRAWLKEGKKKKATHMIVVCDTFDHEDYPVYVSASENVYEKKSEYDGKNMQRVMEVYSLKKNIEDQLAEGRSFNY